MTWNQRCGQAASSNGSCGTERQASLPAPSLPWGDAERIVLNVAALYREFGGRPKGDPPPDLFGMMARIRADRRR